MGDMTVKQSEIARAAIRVGMLINRLQEHIHGKEGDDGVITYVDLSPTQIAAAKILLDKSLPSLQSADITAHSSPESVSEEALKASLIALIRSDPRIIKELAPYLGAYALPAPSSEVGNGTAAIDHEPLPPAHNTPGATT